MKLIYCIIVASLFVPCFAEIPEKISVLEFQQKLETEKNFNKSFGKDQFLEFYRINKKEIWGKDGERELWKLMDPFLKAYDDKIVIETVMKDSAMSDYSKTLMFGWSPYVMSSTNSKIFYVLELIFHVEGAKGVYKYYNSVKTDLNDELKSLPKYNNSPTHYSDLTGLVCSLPNAESVEDKLILSEIVMDYSEFIFNEFVSKAALRSVDSSVTGIKEGLLNYYFFKENAESKIQFEWDENSKTWPHRGDSFNVRKYYESLKIEKNMRQLSAGEQQIILRIENMIDKLQN